MKLLPGKVVRVYSVDELKTNKQTEQTKKTDKTYFLKELTSSFVSSN